jgi:hypothetical protein
MTNTNMKVYTYTIRIMFGWAPRRNREQKIEKSKCGAPTYSTFKTAHK